MEELRTLFSSGQNWAAGAIGATITGLGMIVAGWLRYRGVEKTLESEAENLARRQLETMTDRLQAQLLEERKHCDHMLLMQSDRFSRELQMRDERIESRDKIITEMREEANSMRDRLSSLEKRVSDEERR